jgi:hypothetical protein
MPPTVSLFSANGGWEQGQGADFRFASPRKVLGGFCRDVALHIAQSRHRFKPDAYVWHWPHGSLTDQLCDLDAWPMCKADVRWDRLANLEEFVKAHKLLYEISVWDGHPATQIFYLGCPEVSAYFNRVWEGPYKNRGVWAQRVDSSLKPFIRLRDEGVPVKLFVDAAASGSVIASPPRDANSQSCAAVTRARERYLIPTGVEPRPLKGSEWANIPEIPVMTTRAVFRMYDPDLNPAARDIAMPTSELKGEQIIICNEAEVDSGEYLDELRAGRSVALAKPPAGYATAAEVLGAV